MSQIVAAVYATHADAEAARQALIVDGFEAAGIRLASLEAPDAVVQPGHEGGIRGFFRSLFGLEPDHPDVERYVSAVDSGRTVVTATVDDDRALAAKAVLQRHAPIDMSPGEGYVTDTDRLRNGDAEPEYRTTMPFGESISAGAAGATGLPGARPGTTAIPEAETEALLATPPGTHEVPPLHAPVTPATFYGDPLLTGDPLPGDDPARTQPFVPIAGPMLPPDASGAGLRHAPGLEPSSPVEPASVAGAPAADDPQAAHRPHEVPPLAPIVPPVSSIALPAGREERRRQPR